MLFECEICRAKVKFNGIWSHIRGHKLNKKTYFNTPEKVKYLELLKSKNAKSVKEQSPLCIEFYIKRYGYNAQLEFDKARIKREQLVLEGLKAKFDDMTDDEKLIYNLKKAEATKETSLLNIMEKHNINKDEAYKIYCNKRKESSPRNLLYYTKRGYSENEAKELVSKWQKKMSPRCKEHYIKKGFTADEAQELVSKWQDNLSANSLKERGFSDSDILEFRLAIRDKLFHTKLKKLNITKEEYQDYTYNKKRYYNLVYFFTSRAILLNKIENINKRGPVELDGAYHLDHMYSIAEGYKNNVSPELIGCVENLKMIPAKENIKKQAKCSQTLEELILKKEKNEN